MRATECFSMYSDMSEPDDGALVVEQKFRERARQFGLADAGRPQEKKRADRTVRIAQSRAAAANGVCDARERRVLPDDALAQPLFHVDQFLDFAFEQPADGNAGPLADDLGDFFFADFFLQHRMVFLQLGELVLRGLQFFFRRGQLAVADFGDAGKVAGALVALLFRLQALDLLPSACECAQWRPSPSASGLSARWTARAACASSFSICASRSRECVIGLLAQRLALDFELHDAAFDFVDLGGQRIDFHAQARPRLRRPGRWPCPAENGR